MARVKHETKDQPTPELKRTVALLDKEVPRLQSRLAAYRRELKRRKRNDQGMLDRSKGKP